MGMIGFPKAERLLPGDVIVHKGRKVLVTTTERAGRFVRIGGERTADRSGILLMLKGSRRVFVIREDTRGPLLQPVSGLRDRAVPLRTYPSVRLVRGDGAVHELSRVDLGGSAPADAVHLGFHGPASSASPVDVPTFTWVGNPGLGWRGTVPFVPAFGPGHQGQATGLPADRARSPQAAGTMGAGGVVSHLRTTIPHPRGARVGDDRTASERSGYVRVDSILAGLRSVGM